ncbi:MAG TPA: leucyl/phenylalanyl-tRNA--protein transferase [Vicinamibacteria bacterium]|nr:leucyl/phenylalanyl-tRNA--protein transferase [Vicinamibacteria bacterium]
MPVFKLDERLEFPPADLADDGLLAVGGDLSPERLVLAYSRGIFPWYEDGLPILWHSPDPRMVLEPEQLRVSASLKKTMRKHPYRLTLDVAFPAVIEACASAPRPGQDGTWITSEMRDAYVRLFRLGLAHSTEAWRGDELVGGLYGVSLGSMYFGESMFARAPDASKIAFVTLVGELRRRGIDLIDCQVHTEHLARFGAVEWPRAHYLRALARCLRRPTYRGRWRFPEEPAAEGPAASGRTFNP